MEVSLLEVKRGTEETFKETPKDANEFSLAVQILILSFSLTATSIALTIFMYFLQANARKIDLFGATGADGAISVAIALAPVILLVIAFIILGTVVFLFTSPVSEEESKLLHLKLSEIFIPAREEERIEKEKKFFSRRNNSRNVALVVIALLLMILSAFAIGYVFVPRVSNYSPLIIFAVLFLTMVGSTILFLYNIIANKDVILTQYNRKMEKTPLINVLTESLTQTNF